MATPGPARRATVLLASAAVVVALAGCSLPGPGSVGPDDERPSSAPSFVPKAPVPGGKSLDSRAKVPSPPAVDARDATAVAKAWATTAYSYDTAYDAGPHDAVLRATRYVTGKLADAEREYRPAAGSGDRWNTWAQHRAWTRVKTSLETDGDAPTDTTTTAWRQLAVDGSAQGRDGWSGPGTQLQAFIKLVRDGKGMSWRIAEVNAVEAATVPSAQPSASSDRSE
jgi:hypothetical protein